MVLLCMFAVCLQFLHYASIESSVTIHCFFTYILDLCLVRYLASDICKILVRVHTQFHNNE